MYLALALLGILPSFAWLLFYLSEDPYPEPRRLIVFTFLAGAASTAIAFSFQLLWNGGAPLLGIAEKSVISLLVLAVIEEFFKFGAAYFVVARSRAFDEPVDAMVYLIVAALGFAAVENIGALVSTLDTFRAASAGASAPYGMGFASHVLETTTLRFIGATLLHTLSSAVVGYWWARGILLTRAARFAAFGILVATGLHAAFNYLILRFEGVMEALLFLIVIAFFVLNDFEKLKRQPITDNQ